METKTLVMTIAIFAIVLSVSAQEKGTFTDSRDGKVYKTVKIGTQTWMAENLAFKAPSGCWAYDNIQSNVTICGYLYDWETAKKACPVGWHLPTDDEWTLLTTYLGGDSIAGRKLKSTFYWKNPDPTTTNSSGFTAIPGGNRMLDGNYNMIGLWGYWWSSTENYSDNTTDYAWFRWMYYNLSEISSYYQHKERGLSVRCIKD